MAKVEGLTRVVAALKAVGAKYGPATPRVHVGYRAAYGIFVHENLEAYHPNGQAKFLETPAREEARNIAKIVHDGLKAGLTLEQALLRGGLYLQGKSQELVPVDTGNLRSSAFTEIVKG